MTAPPPTQQPDAATSAGRILTIHPDGRVVVDRLPALHPITADKCADYLAQFGLRAVDLPHGGLTMWLSDVAMLDRTEPNLSATAISRFHGWGGGKVYGLALFTGTHHASGDPAGLSEHRLKRLHADAILLAGVLELPGAAAIDADRVDLFGRIGIEM